jgi:hypothetical protein
MMLGTVHLALCMVPAQVCSNHAQPKPAQDTLNAPKFLLADPLAKLNIKNKTTARDCTAVH